MTEINVVPSVNEVLLGKLSQLIKAQATGEIGKFTTEVLNHAYMSVASGTVDEETNDLLVNILGADWAEGYEASDAVEEAEEEAKDMALMQVIQQVDENSPQETISTLASALMLACRELGWIEASRAAHDQWFYAT